MDYKILCNIDSPSDVKKLSGEEIETLCKEIRDIIIETVSKNGGHLASNLGAVELTVALHRAFNSPEDAIIFDVGHQSYTHKLITGRYKDFNTIRTEGGLSGFMRPAESIHDPFVTGHSSNSISAAYGILRAKRLTGEKGTAIAVIGDGAMTGGMAYEALNNAGSYDGNFIVVLNDNKMSISSNVGAVAKCFSVLRNRPKYHRFKYVLNRLLLKIPFAGEPVYNALVTFKNFVKRIVYHNNIFVSMGFNYLGPVNGHDVEAMENLFKIAKNYKMPSLIHVVTTKGKGYAYAENKPNNYHGVPSFDIVNGAKTNSEKTFSDIAGETLCELAEKDGRICAVTAAMAQGTGLSGFASKYPERFFDVGIAEQHATAFCAGLAKGTVKPFFAVYSSFLQRGYDQIIHDAAIAGLPLKLLVDRAGIVGEDGESHQGLFDVAFLTTVPGMNIYSPSGYAELKSLICKTAENDELCAIRYPRGCEVKLEDMDLSGDFSVLSNGSDNAVVTYGRIFSNAYNAVKSGGKFDIVKLNKLYPISKETVDTLKKYKNIHFFEEGIKSGGIAEKIGCLLNEEDFAGKYTVHAVDNTFVAAATVSSSLKKYGFDEDSILSAFNR